MPYTTGTISTPFNKAFVDEIVGVGTGSQTVFTIATSKPTIFVDSTFTIKYTIGSVQYTGTASNGTITGTNISSGTVTEAGAISITFSTAPDASTSILASYTTKGLVQKIIDYCCSTSYEESLSTSNQIDYTVTLANTTVSKGQCRIRFRIAGTEKEVWDDGEGNFIHTNIDEANSSINYATGAVVIKFLQAIDTGYTVKALYTNGATEGRDWMILLNQNSKNSSGNDAFSGLKLQELVMKNSSVNYKDFICIGLREYQSVTNNVYNASLNVYDKWDNANETAVNKWNSNSAWSAFTGYDTTYNAYVGHPLLVMKDDQMTYFISVNKRRIVVAVKVSATVYLCIYLGGYRRYSTPEQLKCPMIMIGNTVTLSHNSTSTVLLNPNGLITSFAYFFKHDTKEKLRTDGNNRLWPVVNNWNPGMTFPLTVTRTTNQAFVLPMYITQDSLIGVQNYNLYGELDGIYIVVNKDIRTEDILTVNSNNHIVFQNVYRTTQYDYLAVEAF